MRLIININVKNCHESLTTVVRAQNDTSKTANITFSILHVERYTRPYQRSHAVFNINIYYKAHSKFLNCIVL